MWPRVTSREGRVSRNNLKNPEKWNAVRVTSGEGRVSRNIVVLLYFYIAIGHVPRGACE